jgi:hypothetical protein
MLKVWASNILVKVTLVKDDDNMDVSPFMSRLKGIPGGAVASIILTRLQ